MKRILTIILSLLTFNVAAQTDDEPYVSGSAYIGIGREAMVFFKLEGFIYYNDWGQALFNFGYSWAPGSIEDEIYSFNSFHTEIGHTFGYKWIFLHTGIEPALNFQNKVTFIDINGVLALRYQNKSPNSKFRFVEFGYIPKLFTTHKRGINGSFAFAVGITF